MREAFGGAQLSILGLIGVGASTYMVYWSLQYTTAINNLLLQSAMRILMLALPALFFDDAIAMHSIRMGSALRIGNRRIVTKGDPSDFTWG